MAGRAGAAAYAPEPRQVGRVGTEGGRVAATVGGPAAMAGAHGGHGCTPRLSAQGQRLDAQLRGAGWAREGGGGGGGSGSRARWTTTTTSTKSRDRINRLECI